MKLALFALLLPAAWAQEYEIGGIVGYGYYRDTTVFSTGGNATAGIGSGVAAGFVATQNMYQYISGEFHYLYQDGGPFVSSGQVRGNVNGDSHAFDYALLFHARPREAKLQPFFEIGAGAKYYRETGSAQQSQPLPNIVTLTSENEWRFLTTVGVGIKYRWTRHVLLRADFRDYITPFPKRIFVQAQGGTERGWFQQFTPSIGISYVY
jgi:hypothetical protein